MKPFAKIFLVLGLLCSLAYSAFAAQRPGIAQSIPNITITANLASTSFTIPSTFVGISEELYDISPSNPIYAPADNGNFFNGTNTTLINLVKLLGPNGFLRLGGASQDCCGTTGTTYCCATPNTPYVTPTFASQLAGFIAAVGSGWVIDYGLNGNGGTTQWASQASDLLGAIPANKLIFSCFNEPNFDLVPVCGGSPSQACIIGVFNSCYSTITGAHAGTKWAADARFQPDATDISQIIAGITPGLAGLTMFTQHYYPTTSTLSSIFSVISGQNWSPETGVAGQKYVNSEGNFALTGACSPASCPYMDTIVSSLWYVGTAIKMATQGAGGYATYNCIQPFSVGGCATFNTHTLYPYNLESSIHRNDSGNWAPGPRFLGMFLFSKVAGQQIVSTTYSTAFNTLAMATKNSNGNANIIMTNLSTTPISITPAQSAAWTTATVLRIDPSSKLGCADKNPIVGGAPIGEGGAWAGGSFTITNGQSIVLKPCGSALIQILP